MKKKIFVAVSVVAIGLLAMCVAGWIMKSCNEDLEGAQEAFRGGRYMFLNEPAIHDNNVDGEVDILSVIDRLEERINANAGKWKLVQIVTFHSVDASRQFSMPFYYTAIMERREK